MNSFNLNPKTKKTILLLGSAVVLVGVVFLINSTGSVHDSSVVYAISRNQESAGKSLYSIDLKNNNFTTQKLPLESSDIFSALSVKKYSDTLFFFSENESKWSIYAYTVSQGKLDKIKTFVASSPSLVQQGEYDDIIIVNDLITNSENPNPEVNTRILRLSPSSVEEVETTSIADETVKLQMNITDWVALNSNGSLNWFSHHIVSPDKKTSIAYYETHDDKRTFSAVDIPSHKIIASQEIKKIESVKLLGFLPNSNTFAVLQYVENVRGTESVSFNLYDSASLALVSSILIPEVNFLFNQQTVVSDDGRYLLVNLSKARRSVEEQVMGNKTYLLVYDIETKGLNIIQIPDYTVLPV